MHNKTLIICLHPYSDMGGATNKIIQMLNSLNKKNYEIIYIYIKKNFKLNLNSNIKTIKLKNKRMLFSFFEIKRILFNYHKKNFKKKIFISNQNYSNSLTYFLTKDFKEFKSILIERNHLDELYYYNSIQDYLKKNIIKLFMKFTYKNASKIIGNTKKLSKDLSAFVNSKVKMIYSPTNSKEIIRLSKKYKPKNIRKDPKKVRLLSISRFTKRKNLITLLKALRIVSTKYNNIELILIGYGPELDNIKNYIQENKLNKKVFLLPFKKNPYPYFLISDIYIMPSLYEGCPNSIIESLVLNLPVISSNCNSGPEEILLNGRGGFIFEKKNFVELADKVGLYMKNKSIFKKKLNFAKKKIFRFEEKKVISEYLNLFKEI